MHDWASLGQSKNKREWNVVPDSEVEKGNIFLKYKVRGNVLLPEGKALGSALYFYLN